MTKQKINSETAPKAIGPYSQATQAGQTIYLSGQIPLNTEGEIVGENAKDQAHQVMKNLSEVLKAADCTFDNVVKTTIYLASMNDFAEVNEVYSSYLNEPYPARATVEVARLPKDVKVEIDMIAVK